MSRNLELKARYDSLARGRRIARDLGAEENGILRQKDTFLQPGPRRLKLRESTGAAPELIYYGRPDSATRSGRISSFLRVPLKNSRVFMKNWPQPAEDRIIVRKLRRLYLYMNARIHLDAVWGLGSFIEFEVLLVHGKLQADRLLRQLIEAFGVRDGDILGGAYADMMHGRLQR